MWSTTCRGCWLGEAPELPAIGAVREVLAALAELSPTIEKRATLTDRIEKMERDQLAFSEEIVALASLLGIDTGADPVLELAQRVGETVRNAAAARDRHSNLTKRLEEAEARQRELAETAAVHGEQKHRMTAFFEVASLEEVAQKLSDIALRADLVEQAQLAEQDIVDPRILASSGFSVSRRVGLPTCDRPFVGSIVRHLLYLFHRRQDVLDGHSHRSSGS